VLDEKNLRGSEELFRDYDGAESIFSRCASLGMLVWVRWSRASHDGEAPRATYITDYMGVSQIDAKCGCRIDTSVHAGYYLAS